MSEHTRQQVVGLFEDMGTELSVHAKKQTVKGDICKRTLSEQVQSPCVLLRCSQFWGHLISPTALTLRISSKISDTGVTCVWHANEVYEGFSHFRNDTFRNAFCWTLRQKCEMQSPLRHRWHQNLSHAACVRFLINKVFLDAPCHSDVLPVRQNSPRKKKCSMFVHGHKCLATM